MDFIGEIVSEPDPPGINMEQWRGLIREHPNLVSPEPSQAINPFTKEPTVIRPPPGEALVVVDGKKAGSMSWALDDSNLINVWGEPRAVIPLTIEIA